LKLFVSFFFLLQVLFTYYKNLIQKVCNRFIIGNMSNPTINRLGKTQIWYKNYYSDFSYSNFFKKITSFEKFLNKYFQYGIFTKNNLLISKFWYKNAKKLLLQVNPPLYFRKYYYSHQTLTIEHSYFIRLESPEFFTLKLYIIRYNNWVVASIQWFKPLKPLKNKSPYQIHNNTTSNKTLPFTAGSLKPNPLSRTRLFHLFLKSCLSYKKPQYLF
jgi:hypothetical protein